MAKQEEIREGVMCNKECNTCCEIWCPFKGTQEAYAEFANIEDLIADLHN